MWWSLATAATALAKTPLSFISTRILMGMGEAGAYPCNSGIAAKWFPDRERDALQHYSIVVQNSEQLLPCR